MSAPDASLRIGPRGPQARMVCVFVHGRGQSPEEMETGVLSRLDAPDVAFLLPRAPKGAWYEGRAVDPLTSTTRSALDEAIDQLAAAMDEARAAFPGVPVLLGGFSQGACLSIEYVCRGLSAPDALIAFTGCRVGTPQDDRPDDLPKGLPVYLSGGDADPWIPVTAFADAALSLGRSGARLRADLFPGRGHEVCDAEIAMMASVLTDLSAARAVEFGAPR
ncbi:alpha/beta hydrolase [Aureimonas sp. N4]|uniref:alpha/beta hydrolase n=1 Tax=Aureimonas sp. N4 TaxID=1638165 RepID=UPI00078081CA|nr:phospholipase [Aureimonas sp. N4]